MYWISWPRSVSERAAHGGIAPRPVVIFQKRHPSVWDCTFAEVQSAGFGLSAAAPGPSPLPDSPWHAVHALSAVSFFPAATAASFFGTAFFLAFSAAGQVHGPGACAHAGAVADDTESRAAIATVPPRIRRRAIWSLLFRPDRGR